MPEISVKIGDESGNEYYVLVEVRNGSSTSHEVTINKADYQKLTNQKITPEELVRKSFEFLIAREPKEVILKKFNLIEISKYFPDYEQEIRS